MTSDDEIKVGVLAVGKKFRSGFVTAILISFLVTHQSVGSETPKLVAIAYKSIAELAESLQPKLPAGFQEPVMIAESVHVQFRVSKSEVIEGGGCRDCEAYPRLLMAETKGKAPEFSAVIINEAAIAMDRLDVQPTGRDVRLTGKLTVYPASKESPQGRYELFVENVRDVVIVPK